MEKNLMAFLGEKGLTCTSADFIANLAKEMVRNVQSELEAMTFLNKDLELLGSGQKTRVEYGADSVEGVRQMVETIGEANSLIAWLREAIRAKTQLIEEVEKTEYTDIDKEAESLLAFKLRMRKENPCEYLTEEDVIAGMSTDERNLYLTLQAKAAAFGKIVHPQNPLDRARRDMYEKRRKPVEYQENGTGTVITTFSPSIEPEVVDRVFFELQNAYRDYQARLNKIKHDISSRLLADKTAKDILKEKQERMFRDEEKRREMVVEQYRNRKVKEYDALKIIIPPHLKDIYEKVRSLGA